MKKTLACLLILVLIIGGFPLQINATEIYPDNYVDQTLNNDAQAAVDWLEEVRIDLTAAQEESEEINSIKPDTVIDEFHVLREQMDKLRTGEKTTSKWIDSFGNGGNQDIDCLQFGGAENYQRIKANIERYDKQIEQIMLDGVRRNQFQKKKILTTEGAFVDGYRQEHDLSKLQVFSRLEDTIESIESPEKSEAETFRQPNPTEEQPNSDNLADENSFGEKADNNDLEPIQYLDNPDEHQDKEISGTNSDSDEQQIISKTEANNIQLVSEDEDLPDIDSTGSSESDPIDTIQQMEDVSGYEFDESTLTEEDLSAANMEGGSLQDAPTVEAASQDDQANTEEVTIAKEIETSSVDGSSLIEPNAVMSSSSSANWYDYNNYYGPKAINNGHVDQYSAFSSQEETVNPRTGDLIIKTTDLYLPGRNGLDLEIGRLFQSNQAITGDRLSDANGGCFTDYSTYNVDRSALGAGWSFTFPSVEIRGHDTEYEELFYHDGKGSVYHVEFTPENDDSNLENYYKKDIRFDINPNGGFILTRADQTKEYFGDIGTLYRIEDRFGNRINFEYTNVMSMNRAPNFSFEHPENTVSWNKPAGYSYSTNGSLEFDYHFRFTGSTQYSSANSCIMPLKANTAYELRGYINNRLSGGGLAGIGYTLYDINGTPLRSETEWVETTMASSWALPTIVFPSAVESRYVSINYEIFYSSGGYAKLDGVQLCELTPVISKITDSIGRQVVFNYDQYEYSIIEGLTDRQIQLTVSDPTTTDTYQLTYDLELVFGTYTGMVNGQHWAELRTFPVFNSFSNGEVTHNYIYDHATAFYSYRDWGPGVYPPGNASCTQLRLKEMQLPTTKVVYDYGSVIKHLGDHGFYQIDRIVGRSEVPYGSTTPQYHRSYSYLGTHGDISYDNETGWQPDVFDFEKSDHHDYFFTTTMTQDNGLILHQIAQGGKDQSTERLSSAGESQKTTIEAYDPVFKNQPVKIRSDVSSPQGSYTLYQGYTFNDWGGVETETRPLSQSDWDDPVTKQQNTITYEYNNDPVYKSFLKSKSYYQTPTRQLTETNNYDTLGRIVSTVNAKGDITTFEYDANYRGNVTKTTINRPSGNNSITVISYADSSQKNAFPTAITQYYTEDGIQKSSTSTKTYHYLWGQPLSESDAQGNITSYEYDTQGRIKRIVYPASAGTSGTYTVEDHYDYLYPSGQNYFQVAYERLVNGTTSCAKSNNYYDSHGNLVRNETWDDSLNDWVVSTNSFNNYGQVTSTLDPNNNETDYVFDEWDRLAAVTDAQGNQQVYQYDIGNRTNTSYFVTAGGIRENHYVEALDSWGRVTARRGFPNGINHPSVIEETYEYDLLGNCTKVTDPRGNSTSIEYDELNRLVAVENALGERSEYAYDQLGGISQVTQFDGPTQFNTIKRYDERGLLKTKQEPLGTSYNYEYDSRGLLSKTNCPSSKIITYQYYPDGKLKLTASGNSSMNILYHPLGATEGYSCTGDGEGVSYKYSSAGAIKERKAAGKTISFSYDQAGNLTRLTDPFGLGVVHGYDSLNRIQTITVDGKEFVYEYNGDGTIRSVTYPNGATSEYTYDNINRLIGLTNKLGDSVLSSFAYNYDNNGNIIQISANGSVTTYEYDALNRLVSSQNPQGIVRYAYDSRGNRMQISENGFKVPTLGTLEYNDWDQLSDYSKGTSSTGYIYDAEGLRTQKISSQGITRYHCNNNGQVIAESNGSGQVTAQIIWGHKPLARKTGGQYYYYLYNGHGDVIGLIDETGNVVNSYAYDEWGNILSCQEQIFNPIKYAGEYYDEESGLYYLRARYYDPAQGRFISKDSYEGDLTNPLSINQYTYCMDNPVGFVDIDGCMPVYSLNLYSSLYNSNKLTPRELTTAVLLENKLNVWTALHEIAQLNIAKKLYQNNCPATLEYKIYSETERNLMLFKKVYRVDIVAGEFAWEVKAAGNRTGQKQLNQYLAVGGLKAGYWMQPIANIPIIDNIKMKVTFESEGMAYYSFYRVNEYGETETVPSTEVRNQYFLRSAEALAAAGTIMGLTLLEDFASGPLGVLNDIPSFAAAMRAAALVFGI